jgi:hypothetical protein
MTFDPNIESFRYEPYDPEDTHALVEAELELMLAELEATLPPEIEADTGDDRDQNGDR